MRLSDVLNGPEWVVWVVFAILLVISIVLLTGHGSGLIAGYNTATKEEQDRHDKKKMCRVMGMGMSVIVLLILIMGIFKNVLPAGFVIVLPITIALDIIAIIVLGNL